MTSTGSNDGRLEMKVQALMEAIGRQASDYESRLADLRVEVTVASRRLQEMQRLMNEMSQAQSEQNGEE